MTQIPVFQSLIAELDLSLPWLLPALETVEHTAPSTVRLLLCALLAAWFAVLRQRQAASAESPLTRAVP